jgi:hypothetical protein
MIHYYEKTANIAVRFAQNMTIITYYRGMTGVKPGAIMYNIETINVSSGNASGKL